MTALRTVTGQVADACRKLLGTRPQSSGSRSSARPFLELWACVSQRQNDERGGGELDSVLGRVWLPVTKTPKEKCHEETGMYVPLACMKSRAATVPCDHCQLPAPPGDCQKNLPGSRS